MQQFWRQIVRSGKAADESYWTERQTVREILLSTANILNLIQNITLVKNQFWSTHICWDYTSRGHSLLQITLTHRLLQAAHEDNFLSWPVDTFLIAQLCCMLRGNPECNPKAHNFSNDMLWFIVQQILPISNYNSKEEVNWKKTTTKKTNVYEDSLSLHTKVIQQIGENEKHSIWRQMLDLSPPGFNFWKEIYLLLKVMLQPLCNLSCRGKAKIKPKCSYPFFRSVLNPFPYRQWPCVHLRSPAPGCCVSQHHN